MPRRPRLSTGGITCHVLNRRAGRLELFEKPADYSAFEKILAEAHHCTGMRIAAYCLMPNHWQLLLWLRSRRRAVRGHALDHGDPYAAPACSPAFVWDWAGLSGTIQIASGANRRTFSNPCGSLERQCRSHWENAVDAKLAL